MIARYDNYIRLRDASGMPSCDTVELTKVLRDTL